jgi:hypothetical protein
MATLTHSGRAGIALAIVSRPLHLAWGSGDPAWDELGDDALPSLVERNALYNEIGRRMVSSAGFVLPDPEGGIAIPVGVHPDGTVELARYSQTADPTPYIYVRVNYDFEDASNATIRELGVVMDTVLQEGLPPGQMYFTPGQLADPGRLLAMQIQRPSVQRSPAVRQTIEFVLPI